MCPNFVGLSLFRHSKVMVSLRRIMIGNVGNEWYEKLGNNVKVILWHRFHLPESRRVSHHAYNKLTKFHYTSPIRIAYPLYGYKRIVSLGTSPK